MGSRSGSDDEPGDEVEVGGFAVLLLLVGNLEAAIRLQADGDAFLEGSSDGAGPNLCAQEIGHQSAAVVIPDA